jgi:hypothetical protein
MVEELRVVPLAVVEPLKLSFRPDDYVGSTDTAYSIARDDIDFISGCRFARPGKSCAIAHLSIPSESASIDALTALATHLRVEPYLCPHDAGSSMCTMIDPLAVSVQVDVSKSRVDVFVDVPSDVTGTGSHEIRLDRIAIGGSWATGENFPALPLRVCVVTGGMLPPLKIPDIFHASTFTVHAIAADGTLYAPRTDCDTVLIYAADGTPLPPLKVSDYGLSRFTRAAAFDDESQTLVLADCDGNTSETLCVAINMRSRELLWRSSEAPSTANVAILVNFRVVVASSYLRDLVSVFSLNTGIQLCTLGVGMVGFLAAHPTEPIVYASTFGTVTQLRWTATESGAGGAIDSDGVALTWTGASHIALAVVSAPGTTATGNTGAAFLVAAKRGDDKLRVFALPQVSFVHEHELHGMTITGLAADPTGASLEVVDSATGSAHVLAWPLSSMPDS